MFLAAGEVDEGKRELRVGHDPEITLHAAVQAHRGFGRAGRNHRLHPGRGHKGFHDGLGMLRGDKEVEVVHCLLAAPEAASHLRPGGFRLAAQVFQDFADGRGHLVHTEGVGIFGAGLDGFEQFGRGFFAETGQLGGRSGFAGALQIGDGAHPEFSIQSRDFFCPQAGDVE